jgi:hypothetical protein
MNLAHKVLLALGARQVFKIENGPDPQTEEEFNKLEYESSNPITWQQYQEKLPEIEQKFGVRYLRQERDRLLQKTDWIMTVDNFQTLANKEEWVAYRKVLRDLPQNPPPFKWKNMVLDFENMSLPVQPPIIRLEVSS